MSYNANKCAFVAMPFAERFVEIYGQGIVAAADDVGLALKKLGRLPTDEIVLRMEEEIRKADFVASVATGRNPHVYCEIGIAHAAKKPCIIMAEDAAEFEIFRYAHSCFVYGSDLAQVRTRLREEFSRLVAM